MRTFRYETKGPLSRVASISSSDKCGGVRGKPRGKIAQIWLAISASLVGLAYYGRIVLPAMETTETLRVVEFAVETQEQPTPSTKSETSLVTTATSTSGNPKGAVVFLAPQRNEGSLWGIDRFCMLLRAVRSIDQHWSQTQFGGGYPVYILVAKDYELDPKGKDGPYTEADQALIRRWAPHTTIHFVPIEMYSGEALEPDTTREQILAWRDGQDGAVAGRDLGYTSMCRLWSGRLQSMSFLDGYKYYLRMDDDSLLMSDLPFDPFEKMETEGLYYAYRRVVSDRWGVKELWNVTVPHLDADKVKTGSLPFLTSAGFYHGLQPYNNFHVSRIDFWRDETWQRVWKDYNDNHLFYKHRVGDANVHAMAIMLMVQSDSKYEIWGSFPYVHNSNDFKAWFQHAKSWNEECQRDYDAYLKST